jgi:hypothetical protein
MPPNESLSLAKENLACRADDRSPRLPINGMKRIRRHHKGGL